MFGQFTVPHNVNVETFDFLKQWFFVVGPNDRQKTTVKVSLSCRPLIQYYLDRPVATSPEGTCNRAWGFFFEFLISRTVQISSKPHWDEVVRTFCHFCFCLQQETISWNHRDCWCNSYRGDNNRRIPNNWRLPGRLLHNWKSLNKPIWKLFLLLQTLSKPMVRVNLEYSGES